MLFGTPVCGNNLVEEGEDCDCGNRESCDCCDAATCTFAAEAECFDGDCCSNCKLRKVGSQCRGTENDCDLAEYCNGIDEYCPRNDFKQNGMLCDNEQGMCLDGTCQVSSSNNIISQFRQKKIFF